MEMVATLALQVGSVIAEDVISQGNVIVPKNTAVNEKTIQKLNMFRIMGVCIYEPADFAKSYMEKVKLSKEFAAYQDMYNIQLIAYKVSVDSFVYNHVPFRTQDLLAISDALCPPNLSFKQLLTYINLITPKDEELSFSHGLNCALIAKKFGERLGLKPEEITLLTLSGFIFDVGKNMLPQDIIYKPAKLEKMEYDLVKTHAFHAYHLLSRTNLDKRILNTVLQHHERCDGSGYPQGLTDAQIDPYSKIIAIVDVYEAMTAPRSYRPPMCPYKAISIFEKEFLQKYDISFVQSFMKSLSDELIGSRVKLNSGDEGEVIMANPRSLARPMIRMDDGSILDIASLPYLEIVELV